MGQETELFLKYLSAANWFPEVAPVSNIWQLLANLVKYWLSAVMEMSAAKNLASTVFIDKPLLPHCCFIFLQPKRNLIILLLILYFHIYINIYDINKCIYVSP